MLAICAGIAVGLMVAIGGARDGGLTDYVAGEGATHGSLLTMQVAIGDYREPREPDVADLDSRGLGEAQDRDGGTRLVLGALAGDGTPEPGVTAAAVSETVAIPEPTVVVLVGDAVERWRPLVASIFPDFAVDAVLRVIRCESGGNPNATGHAGERGLLQIHPLYHPDSTYDPEGNLRAGFRISSGGTDWSAWTCRP